MTDTGLLTYWQGTTSYTRWDGKKGYFIWYQYVTKIFTIISMLVLFACLHAEYLWKFRNGGWFAIQTFWYFASRVNRAYNRGSPAKSHNSRPLRVRRSFRDVRIPWARIVYSTLFRVCEIEKRHWMKRVKKTRDNSSARPSRIST